MLRSNANMRYSSSYDAGSDLNPLKLQKSYAVINARIGIGDEDKRRKFDRGEIGADGKPQAFDVRLGISDGSMTELMMPANSPLADTLKVGAEVIVGTQSAAPRAASGPRFSF